MPRHKHSHEQSVKANDSQLFDALEGWRCEPVGARSDETGWLCVLAGQPATVSTVADALNTDRPGASKLVAAAVEAGLVERRADQADGRRSFLARTPAGMQVTEQVHNFRRRLISAALSSWDNSDVCDFARLLNRFITDFASVTR